jgi:hypothetical protein
MIYIYCDFDILPYFIDFINTLIFNYENMLLLTTDINVINEVCHNNYIIFMQYIPIKYNIYDNKKKIFLFNTEQLSRKDGILHIQNINNNINIIDYSLANIKYINLIKNNKALYLPYLINTNEIYNYDKTNDIAIIGAWGSEYRNNILQQLALNTKINYIEGFDKNRDEFLFRHKILLNVHYDTSYRIFEQWRCNRCILNKMIVITEESEDIDYELKEFIIECKYEDLVTTTINVLQNYEYYYNMLFKNFDIDLIKNKYKIISDDFFKQIN